MSSAGRRILSGALALALLGAGWAVKAATPSRADIQAPFVLTAAMGERAVGRNLDVTVTSATGARTVTTASSWQAEGRWLVVGLDAAAVTSQKLSQLAGATLAMGGLDFRASERPASLLGQTLVPGVPRRGALAFELPAELEASDAILRLSLGEDSRLDTVVEVALPLDGVSFDGSLEIPATVWATP